MEEPKKMLVFLQISLPFFLITYAWERVFCTVNPKKTIFKMGLCETQIITPSDTLSQFSLLKAQRMYLQGKGGDTGLSHWNMRRLGICGAAPPKPDI